MYVLKVLFKLNTGIRWRKLVYHKKAYQEIHLNLIYIIQKGKRKTLFSKLNYLYLLKLTKMTYDCLSWSKTRPFNLTWNTTLVYGYENSGGMRFSSGEYKLKINKQCLNPMCLYYIYLLYKLRLGLRMCKVFFFFFLRNKHTHTQGRGKGVLTQRHITTLLKSWN